MAADVTTNASFSESPAKVSEWRRFVRVFFQRRIVIFGFVVLIILVLTAIFANQLAPYDPYKQNLKIILQPPSGQHLLGTDPIGRDTLSRLIFGTRTALLVGFVSVSIASVLGVTLGILAGYFRGITNVLIMRFTDILMPFPMIVLALLLAAVLGGGIQNVIIALGIATIPGYIRIMCGMTLSIKENDYILAARSMGASHVRMMWRHILPNAIAPIIVVVTLQLGFLILAEAGLSFLGVGIRPPGAAWGAMVNEGYRYLVRQPILSVAPGAAIMLVVFAFNIVGDALRDALDPRLRGTL
ncbi:MAG: ABC transporter permease [Chloroflexi bacterium RBG_16_56_11]|nr:MAG: ABC transporter permease [Chloroflexi bacterium RBG_16_56_11]